MPDLPSLEPSREYPAVVEHQKVSGLEEVADIVEVAVGQISRSRVHYQQTRVVARLQRSLGNQVFRQVVIEVAGAHLANRGKYGGRDSGRL